MEWSTLAALVLAMSGVATLFASALYRRQDIRQDIDAKTLTDALRPINEALIRHDKNHADHYQTSNQVFRIAQRLEDHERHDDERFGAMMKMQEEIRADVKTLLGRGAQ